MSAIVSRDADPAILLVDDNPAKRLAIRSVLGPLGHPVVEATSGEEALRAVMTRTFAVILMDVQMTGMDGYETAGLIRMRRECEHTPIIFITAYASGESAATTAYASGAVDFMYGTIVPSVLRAKVAIFVELFRKSRDLESTLSEVTRLGERFRDAEAHTRAILQNVADGIVTLTDEGIIESFNRAAARLFGYASPEVIGRPFTMLVKEEPPAPGPLTEQEHQARGAGSTEATGRRKDGSTFTLELNLSRVRLGTRTIHIGCLRDISERQIHTATLRHQTLHDTLTGLPNRVLFGDRVQHAIAGSARNSTRLALIVLDLNDFKLVNDTLGHQHGDTLLQRVSERLVGCLRAGDTVARLGGDEFGILAGAGTDLAAAATVAWKIQQALEPAFVVDEHRVVVRASIGITLFPDHGDNIDDLLRRADLAMYDAKRSGGGYALFAAEQEDAPVRRLALLNSLRGCVERDELVLHYQPKIDLATGSTIGLEALLRWNHPSGRLVMPGEFIPEIEDTDLMAPITEWVIGAAVRRLRSLRAQGFDLTMAVNLSARCVAEGTELHSVERFMREANLPPESLTLELTESALLDTAGPQLLSRLQHMAQGLSIDDFGTGYSSLAYLQRLPVTEIKADRTFVMTMTSVREDAVIVRSIIDLAHNLSVNVVAEGVEDEATMDLLVEFGCDQAQGYFFARPMPGDALGEFLDSSRFGCHRTLLPAGDSAD